MKRYVLDDLSHKNFSLAIQDDNEIKMIEIVENAIKFNNWPESSWISIGVSDKEDIVWRVACQGSPKCFEAIISYIFSNPRWCNLRPEEVDRRVARFPVDVSQYIAKRLFFVGSGNSKIIEPELVRIFLEYLSNPAVDAKSAELLKRNINSQLVTAFLSARIQMVGRQQAEDEKEILTQAVVDSISKAEPQAAKRRAARI